VNKPGLEASSSRWLWFLLLRRRNQAPRMVLRNNLQLSRLKLPDGIAPKIRPTLARFNVQRAGDAPDIGIILEASYAPLSK